MKVKRKGKGGGDDKGRDIKTDNEEEPIEFVPKQRCHDRETPDDIKAE